MITQKAIDNLQDAITEKKVDIVRALITAQPKLINDNIIQHALLQKGGYDIISLLIEYGTDLNYTAHLDWAIVTEQHDIAELLILQYGANVHAESYGSTFLHRASAYDGFEKIVTLLIERGLAVDPTGRSDKRTPLHYASEFGCYETAKLLIECGANVNAQIEPDGGTPLYEASRTAHCAAHYKVIKLLLDNKADVNLHAFEFNPMLFHTKPHNWVSIFEAIQAFDQLNASRKSSAIAQINRKIDQKGKIDINLGLICVILDHFQNIDWTGHDNIKDSISYLKNAITAVIGPEIKAANHQKDDIGFQDMLIAFILLPHLKSIQTNDRSFFIEEGNRCTQAITRYLAQVRLFRPSGPLYSHLFEYGSLPTELLDNVIEWILDPQGYQLIPSFFLPSRNLFQLISQLYDHLKDPNSDLTHLWRDCFNHNWEELYTLHSQRKDHHHPLRLSSVG